MTTKPNVIVLPPVTRHNDNHRTSKWTQGYIAREQGVSLLDCPYPNTNAEIMNHAAWMSGWLKADEGRDDTRMFT